MYERDVMGHAIPPDEQRAYGLLLNWIKAQEAIGQVDVDYRELSAQAEPGPLSAQGDRPAGAGGRRAELRHGRGERRALASRARPRC